MTGTPLKPCLWGALSVRLGVASRVFQILPIGGGELMLDTEAFREFKQGLTLLRDDYALKALPHMRRAMELDKNNPYYMSYLGVVLARSEQRWGEAEKLC